MFLKLMKNGSLLDKHFDRFLTGIEKPYAILDINFKTTEPQELNGKYKELEEKYYTYVVQTQALYRGMELFKSGQGAEPPLVTVSFILVCSHISYRMAAQSVGVHHLRRHVNQPRGPRLLHLLRTTQVRIVKVL